MWFRKFVLISLFVTLIFSTFVETQNAMKKIIFFSITLFLCQLCFAQDTIVKYNGEQIRAKVTEINSTEIKFKKYDFLDGPTYVEKKSEIESIRYSTGLKEHFEKPKQNNSTSNQPDYYGGPVATNPGNKIYEVGSRYRYQYAMLGEREMQGILMQTNDKHIMGLVTQAKQAKGMQYIGFGGIACGIAAGYCLVQSMTRQQVYTSGYSTYRSNPNEKALQAGAALFAIVGIACPVASGVYKAKRSNYNRDAIKLYNQKY